MAETILIEIGTKIIEKLGSAALKKLKSLKDLESNIQKLRENKSNIAAELHKFDPFESSTDREYDDLVHFFEKLETRAKQKEVMSFYKKILSTPNQLVWLFVTAGKVNALMKEHSIVSHSSGENQNSSTTSATETCAFRLTEVLIGRDTDKENIVNYICNDSTSKDDRVVAIVGVGGQGKTTLAQFVCQDDRVKGSFDQQLWVSLTPQSSINEILQKMIISATGQEPIYSGLQQLGKLVLQAINGNKCLLVLDNVYYYENLRDDSKALSAILADGRFWSNGGRILITSRSKKVAKYMSSNPYELHDLAEDDCWTLLRHYANEDDNNDCAVEEVGKEIVSMCPKVPLVLKIVGCNLGYKDISYWKSFKNNLESIPTLYIGPASSYFIKQQEKIKQTLKLCYDQLGYNLKRCAAFCSLFPKGHLYDKNYMVHIWIALGFVEPIYPSSRKKKKDPSRLEDVGLVYVFELTERAIFEEAHTSEFFKIHDVMHDLMQFIGKDEHQLIDSKTQDIVEGVRHVSLNKDLNWDVLLSSTSHKQTLKTILLVWKTWEYNCGHAVRLGSKIDRLISASPKLKILELYNQDIKEVPSCIGRLIYMRYLDLSTNYFCELPKEIANLVNLSTLNLSCCVCLRKLPQEMEKMVNLLSLNLRYCVSLKELPRGIWKLVNLTHLWVKWSGLRCMPEGFGRLTNLETLDVFVVGRSWCGSSKAEVGANLEELGHLKNLTGDLRIKLGEESKYIVSEVGKAWLEKKVKLSKSIRKLEIVFKKMAEEDQTFLEGIQLWGEKLEELFLYNYGGKGLPVWITNGQFQERFPELSTLVRQCDETIHWYTTSLIDKDKNEFIKIHFVTEVDWMKCSRCKGELQIGDAGLSFKTRRDGQRQAYLTGQTTLHHVHFNIRQVLVHPSYCRRHRDPFLLGLRAPKNKEKRQADDLFERCFPKSSYSTLQGIGSCFYNINFSALGNISKLEVIPEEFRDLSSFRVLNIVRCQESYVIPSENYKTI